MERKVVADNRDQSVARDRMYLFETTLLIRGQQPVKNPRLVRVCGNKLLQRRDERHAVAAARAGLLGLETTGANESWWFSQVKVARTT